MSSEGMRRISSSTKVPPESISSSRRQARRGRRGEERSCLRKASRIAGRSTLRRGPDRPDGRTPREDTPEDRRTLPSSDVVASDLVSDALLSEIDRGRSLSQLFSGGEDGSRFPIFLLRKRRIGIQDGKSGGRRTSPRKSDEIPSVELFRYLLLGASSSSSSILDRKRVSGMVDSYGTRFPPSGAPCDPLRESGTDRGSMHVIQTRARQDVEPDQGEPNEVVSSPRGTWSRKD